MPNVGKPSTGCFACRRMKVRCDETKPFCSRCTRAKRSCPGYADHFRYEQPAARRDRSRQTKQAALQTILGSQRASPVRRSLGICMRTTTTDWYDRARRFFFHTHTLPADQTSGPTQGYLNLVETYCSSSGRELYLKEALQAVSLVTLSHRVSQFKWMITKAISHYAKALQGIRLALANGSSISKDDLLIALWCVEKVELMNGLQDITQIHSNGISAIVSCRGSSQLSSELGRQLFYALNLELTARDCIFGTRLHYPMDASHPPRFHLYSAAAQLIAEYRTILTGQNQTSLESLAQRAITLDEELESLPQDLAPVRKSFEQTMGKFQLVAHYFDRNIDAISWLYYHTIRLRTLRIANLSAEAPQDVTEKIRIQGLAIASLIPALLGQNPDNASDPLTNRFSCAAAVFAMHACSSVMSCTELDEPDLRQWTLNQYIYIGNTYGIKEAFAFRGYFLSGTAMSDVQTLRAAANGTFPRLAPVFMVGQEKNVILPS